MTINVSNESPLVVSGLVFLEGARRNIEQSRCVACDHPAAAGKMVCGGSCRRTVAFLPRPVQNLLRDWWQAARAVSA